ncbi:hypothetical protein Athai_41070 [Actinocatenispora thailandica]|uniref:Uncharacterized protein n=1 Tax=Actinocatenispora thailandica TaxID=227318 RepID=A0A7R7HYT6_9ACTN|nr:hypothetical protein Athai_41070 [Actinocatenispora thailandica]
MLGSALAGLVLAAVGTAPALAAPSPKPSASPGHKVCTISDQRIDAITGLTATAKGYAVVNNVGPGEPLAIYQLDSHCNVTGTLTDSQGRGASSPQDIGATKDGTLWVADTGDADKSRDTIAVWKIPAGNSPTQLYRMSYPSGAGPVDARSLLMQPDGTPIVVTYQAGVGKVYEPTAKLSANATTPLKSMGSIKLAATGTPGGSVGPAAQRVFTGGAVSPDGTRAVLRTFTDAYEWKISGGDVAKSIVSGKPVRTPLPNEPSGEAITYSADGGSFLTVSDTSGTSAAPKILKYAPAVAPAPTKRSAAAKSTAGSGGGGLLSGNINLSDIKELVIVVGVLGLALVVVGIVGIRRARRRGGPPGPEDGDRRDDRPRPSGPGPDRRRGPADDDAETAYIPRVEEARESRLRGEPPDRRTPPRAQQPPYADEPPEPSRARPYVPPVEASMRGRRRNGPEDEPTLPPTSRRRYDAADEPTLPPRSGPHGRPEEPARGARRRYDADDEPTLPPRSRQYGGRPDDEPARSRQYGGRPDDEPARSRQYGRRPDDEPARRRYDADDEPTLPPRSRQHGRSDDDPTLPPRSRRRADPGEVSDVDTAVIDKVRDDPPRGRGPAGPPPVDPRSRQDHGRTRPQPPADRGREKPPPAGRSRRPRDDDHEIDWLDDLR